MILPIVAYGSPVLRKVCEDIPDGYEGLDKLVADMWETMYHSNGVGLAAPQINKAVRLFVVDSEQIFANQEADEKGVYSDEPGYKGVFINAHITDLKGDAWAYNEGCLSIPKIREDINRQETVTLDFLDENLQPHTQTFTGLTARIILHEYDHIEGKLFIDYLKPLKKKLLRGKLDDITKGKVKTDYRMVYIK
jgi:peptide deformylase